MTCKMAQLGMAEYADGMLESPQTTQMAAHLALCPNCARLAREQTAARALLRSLPPMQTSAHFEARLAARVAAARQPAPRQRWWEVLAPPAPRLLRPALALGAATFTVAGALFLHPWAQSPTIAPADDYSGLIAQSVALHERDVAAQPLAAPAATGVAASHSIWTADAAAQGGL